MTDINEEIRIAQKIISKNEYNNKSNFHRNSFIYKFTNENINIFYNYINNKEKVLEVISSGDQILNSILGNTYNIDAFDISIFPKHLLFLKIGAIERIKYEDFIDFFINNSKHNEYYDDIYYMIRKNLELDERKFWDSLFNFFDWKEIYNSSLFSREPNIETSIINKNKYLNEEEYYKLKNKLSNINLNIYISDINKLVNILNNKYDTVYLSNIINYKSTNEYKKLLNNLKLSDNGLCISYLFNLKKNLMKMKEIYNSNNISFIQNMNNSSGIMIYKKE